MVTLCHKCHEELHNWQDFEDLTPGDYYYDTGGKGVGIVENKESVGIYFRACWTEEKHWQEDGHGRLFVEAFSQREYVRKATKAEIDDFWNKIETYYDIDTVITYWGCYLRKLLPNNHPIRVKARNVYKEALEVCKKQWAYISKTFNYTLIVSDEYYALLENNRNIHYHNWPTNELPYYYFKIAPIKDVKQKTKKNNIQTKRFDEIDFSKYRAATTDELQEWLYYEYHIANLHDEIGEDDLPF